MGESWIGKQQAAAAVGVSTKTIEKLAKAGKLRQQSVPREGRPPIVVFHSGDVERQRKARQAQDLPAVVPGNTAASGGALVRRTPRAALAAGDAGAVPIADKHRVTFAEAGQLGYCVSELRELVAARKLKICRGYRNAHALSVADLEKLRQCEGSEKYLSQNFSGTAAKCSRIMARAAADRPDTRR